MNARFTRLAAIALVAVALAMTARPAFAATYFFNFSSSLSPWIKGNDPGASASSLTLAGPDNACPVGAPGAHARLTVGPPYMPFDGVWMFARFPATAQTVDVRVKFQAKEDFHCPGCIPIVYVGTTIPGSSAAFTSLPPVSSTAWTPYMYGATLSPTTGAVVVAIGWKGTPSSLPAAVGIDCVEVTTTP
jgi:hypothetical protein